MVSTHANIDSNPEIIVRNHVFKCSYSRISHEDLPSDLNMFMKAVSSSVYEINCKIISIGAFQTKKDAAEQEGRLIIETARANATKIYESGIADLEKRKRELETEIAALQYERNKLKLEIALIKPTAPSGSHIAPPPGYSNPIPLQQEYTKPILTSRILPIINVEKMKEAASELTAEARERFVSANGLNIKAVEFKVAPK